MNDVAGIVKACAVPDGRRCRTMWPETQLLTANDFRLEDQRISTHYRIIPPADGKFPETAGPETISSVLWGT